MKEELINVTDGSYNETVMRKWIVNDLMLDKLSHRRTTDDERAESAFGKINKSTHSSHQFFDGHQSNRTDGLQPHTSFKNSPPS